VKRAASLRAAIARSREMRLRATERRLLGHLRYLKRHDRPVAVLRAPSRYLHFGLCKSVVIETAGGLRHFESISKLGVLLFVEAHSVSMVDNFFAKRVILLLKVLIRRLQLRDLALQLRDFGLACRFTRSTLGVAPPALGKYLLLA
jgi:hypothetical protein